jgi:putative transposase
MKKARFGEERIIAVLKEQQAGIPVAELCPKHGISDATFYNWRSRYGGMGVLGRAAAESGLEEENRKLNQLLAESILDVATLRGALGKKLLTPGSRRTWTLLKTWPISAIFDSIVSVGSEMIERSRYRGARGEVA